VEGHDQQKYFGAPTFAPEWCPLHFQIRFGATGNKHTVYIQEKLTAKLPPDNISHVELQSLTCNFGYLCACLNMDATFELFYEKFHFYLKILLL